MAEVVELVEPGFYFSDNLFTWGRNNSLNDDADFQKRGSTTSKTTAILRLHGADIFWQLARIIAFNWKATLLKVVFIGGQVLKRL